MDKSETTLEEIDFSDDVVMCRLADRWRGQSSIIDDLLESRGRLIKKLSKRAKEKYGVDWTKHVLSMEKYAFVPRKSD